MADFLDEKKREIEARLKELRPLVDEFHRLEAAVRTRPGITIPEIAEAMGIQQNYLYRVLPALQKDGLVRKEGRGWQPREAA